MSENTSEEPRFDPETDLDQRIVDDAIADAMEELRLHSGELPRIPHVCDHELITRGWVYEDVDDFAAYLATLPEWPEIRDAANKLHRKAAKQSKGGEQSEQNMAELLYDETPKSGPRYRVSVDESDGKDHDAYLMPDELITLLMARMRGDDLTKLVAWLALGPRLQGGSRAE